MNLYLRLFILMIKAFCTRQYSLPMDTVVSEFRVLPNDLDLNLHMNNGRYLTIMDLGRLDLLRRNGILLPALRRKWFPIVGEIQVMFFRPIGLLQKYSLHSKIEFVDDKWFVLSQVFKCGDKVMATGLIRGLLRGPEGNINPIEILKLSPRYKHGLQFNPIDPSARVWAEQVDQARRQQKSYSAD